MKLVVFSVIERKLKVFLLKDSLPSRRLIMEDSLDKTAIFLFEKSLKTPLGKNYLEQLYTFSDDEGIVVSYFILLPDFKIVQKFRSSFVEVKKISRKFLDYPMIDYASQRLRWKIEYTNVVYSLLPDEFAFSDLQSVYEAILGRKLDKRNFRRKILSLEILKETGHIKKQGRARPAELYRFKNKKLEFVKVL